MAWRQKGKACECINHSQIQFCGEGRREYVEGVCIHSVPRKGQAATKALMEIELSSTFSWDYWDMQQCTKQIPFRWKLLMARL